MIIEITTKINGYEYIERDAMEYYLEYDENDTLNRFEASTPYGYSNNYWWTADIEQQTPTEQIQSLLRQEIIETMPIMEQLAERCKNKNEYDMFYIYINTHDFIKPDDFDYMGAEEIELPETIVLKVKILKDYM